MMIQLTNHHDKIIQEDSVKHEFSNFNDIQKTFELSIENKPFCLFEVATSKQSNNSQLYYIKAKAHFSWDGEKSQIALKGYFLVINQTPSKLSLSVFFDKEEYRIMGVSKNGRFEIIFSNSLGEIKTTILPYQEELKNLIFILPSLIKEEPNAVFQISSLKLREIKNPKDFETYVLEYPSADLFESVIQ